jgi:hypothetical protein
MMRRTGFVSFAVTAMISACASQDAPRPAAPQERVVDLDAGAGAAPADAAADPRASNPFDPSPAETASSSMDAGALDGVADIDTNDYGSGSGAFSVSLERTACFGTCPMYTVVVGPHGAVRMSGRLWDGKKFVDGCAYKNIGDDGVKEIQSLLAKNTFFSLQNQYQGGPTDAPSTNSKVTDHRKTKEVHHYMAAPVPPSDAKRLNAVENEIDRITGAAQIVQDRIGFGKCKMNRSTGKPRKL